jgi:3-methyladenine DNA glycosylase AlkD
MIPEREQLSRTVAVQIADEIDQLPRRNTPNIRAIRRRYSRELQAEPAATIYALARQLIDGHELRWVAYELIGDHKGAYQSLNERKLEALGQGMDSWDTVDSFARTLSGPAWRDGLISIEPVQRWARSPDRWWRRAALVSTVALNVRSHGGYGDTDRTLAICQMLVDDQDDMVVKALSWALRHLVPHDPVALRAFLQENEEILAARVKREVRNKLESGLKNPRRKG